MIFGFMSLFTVATLTRTLAEEPLERDLAADVYQEANLVANEYLPHYFLGQIDESAVHTQLVGMEAHLDGAVWFVDREGNMITSAHSDGYPYSNRLRLKILTRQKLAAQSMKSEHITII